MRVFLAICFLGVAWQSALASDPARGFDWGSLLAKELPHRFYVGAGANFVHHTGYVPNSLFNAETWVGGAKASAGALLTDQIRFETGYYYLGKASFREGSPVLSAERSQAAGAALLVYTPELSRWGLPSPLPTRIFGRVGAAYKWIDHRSVFGNFTEGGLSYLIGGGVEVDLTSRVFFRFEYEYMSKIASGTKRAIDIQHTPLTLVVGGRL